MGREFVLYSDHESPKHLHSQHIVGANFAKWSAYIQEFTFTICHKSGKENVILDALSCRKHLQTTMAISVAGFERIKEAYETDKDFGTIYKEIRQGEHLKHPYFSVRDGYLFNGSHLCLPNTSIREHVIGELHSGGCSGHLGRDKTDLCACWRQILLATHDTLCFSYL